MKKFLGWGSLFLSVGNLAFFILALNGHETTGITGALNYLIIALFAASIGIDHLKPSK